ncbi:MAG: hypothetical protein ACYS6K_22895 [Planctomycetota bacterium]
MLLQYSYNLFQIRRVQASPAGAGWTPCKAHAGKDPQFPTTNFVHGILYCVYRAKFPLAGASRLFIRISYPPLADKSRGSYLMLTPLPDVSRLSRQTVTQGSQCVKGNFLTRGPA